MKKISQDRIRREGETKNFLYRLGKLFSENKLNYADCLAISLRHVCGLYPEIAELWPTYFSGKVWPGLLGNVADCRILHCPECDSFKAMEQFEYRSNAKLTRSRLCVVCLAKWRLDRKKGKLPFQILEKKYGKQPRKVYDRKGYESRKILPKPEGPPKDKAT